MKKLLFLSIFLINAAPIYASNSWTPLKLSLNYDINNKSNLRIPVAESVRGIEVGLLEAKSEQVYGIQAGLGTECSTLYGLQTSMFSNVTKEVYGVQICGLVNYVNNKVYGIQVAAINGFPDNPSYANPEEEGNGVKCDFVGIEIGGLVNMTDKGIGVQIGTGNNANHFAGSQIGLVNECGYKVKARASRDLNLMNTDTSNGRGIPDNGGIGIQWGLVNSCKSEFVGLQFGIYNYCHSLTGVQVGLINRIKNPRKAIASIMPIINWSW